MNNEEGMGWELLEWLIVIFVIYGIISLAFDLYTAFNRLSGQG